MVVLRAIGGFFVKIGRWIKDTAWVQPLLIVGGIFAIIFSIPYISKWVSSWFSDSNAATSFFEKYEKSLSGADDGDSDADKLFTYMQTPDDKKSVDDVKKYGDKFFVVFVQEDCAGCDEIYEGFEVLDDNWGKGIFSNTNDEEFKMYTIFIDTEETINDEKKNLFKDYFFDSVGYLFEEVTSVMQESNYAKNCGNTENYIKELDTLNTVDGDSPFASPTVFLYDPACKDNVTQLGVSEVLFTVPGKGGETGAYPIARTLFDCWFHQDVFSANPNA